MATLKVSFFRSQIAAIIATIVDFGTLIFCVEVLHVWYVAATAIGAALGAITNFLIGRYWSFSATHSPAKGQVVRYAIVSFGSLVLNSAGVAFLTETFHLVYWISKAITAAAVGLCYNFVLHRFFVFRPAEGE